MMSFRLVFTESNRPWCIHRSVGSFGTGSMRQKKEWVRRATEEVGESVVVEASESVGGWVRSKEVTEGTMSYLNGKQCMGTKEKAGNMQKP